MNPWLISDTHIDHKGLIEENFRPKDFSEKIIKHLKGVLTDEDLLIHLGDVSFTEKGNDDLTSLPGKKWLVMGNHDSKSIEWYLKHGWNWAGESMSLTLFGKEIIFSHAPVPVQRSTMINGHYSEMHYDINIHGHFHDFGEEKVRTLEPQFYNILTKKHFLISLEHLNYQPIKLKRVIELFNQGKNYGFKGINAPQS